MATQPTWYQDPRNKMRERSIGVMALIGIFCFVAVAGTIFAFYFLPNPDLLLSKEEAEARKRKLVHVTLLDVELLVPSNLLARVKRRTLGAVSQVDLNVPWPYTGTAKAVPPEEIENHENQLLITFIQTPAELTDAERFAGIYRPYLSGKPQKMQANLLRHRFSTSSPYADIEYYTGKIGTTTVYIKCELRPSSLGPQLCSNQFSVSAQTTLRYRFALRHLAQWREIDQTARQLLLQMMHLREGERSSS
jgi:hypothetical protein